MGARPRRPRLVALKFKTLAAGLVGLALIGYISRRDKSVGFQWRTGHERDLATQISEIPVGLASSQCNCSTCFEPTDYAFTCCEKDSNLCLTAHHEVCTVQQLCAAELVPGGSGAAECLQEWELQGGIALYIFLLLYIFLGLAIVCDDYFVPSLEKISDGLQLSADVAGATFMAAGSSAPELFVSLADNVIANPPKSIGIGTIIGSAIFNILVIIGLSAVLAGQALALDWHPLARDSFFYTMSIVLLIAVVYDGEVRWYEGLILFLAYCLYVGFMVFNQRFFDAVDRLIGYDSAANTEQLKAQVDALNKRNGVNSDSETGFDANGEQATNASNDVELALKDGNVAIDANEVKEHEKIGKTTSLPVNAARMAHTVETSRPAEAVDAARSALGRKRRESDPHVVVPAASGVRRRSNQNPLHMSKFRSDWRSMSSFDSKSTKTFKDAAQQVMRANAASKIWVKTTQEGRAAREDAQEQARPSTLSQDTRKPSIDTSGNSGDEEEGWYWDCLVWPVVANEGSNTRSWAARACRDWGELWQARVWHVMTFPLNVLFRTTIPDCNYDVFCEDKQGDEENRRIGYSLTFFMCIVWIAVLSHLVTFSAAKFGCIVGISPPVMGLTILAAGTSIPDALSSIIVARNGEGDMAVANSIGSNVFDILIGLGFPWFIAEFVYSRPSAVLIDDLWVGIGFLFGVLVLLVGVVVLNRWILRKRVGIALLFLYAFYVIFQLFIEPIL